MLRNAPPTFLCNSRRMVVLPWPVPLHRRRMDPRSTPTSRESNARFCAGHKRILDGLDVIRVKALLTVAHAGKISTRVAGVHAVSRPILPALQEFRSRVGSPKLKRREA